jgi:hypothetical protein
MTSDSLVAMKWCDRQVVRMLSALHSGEIVNNGKCDWKTKQLIMKLKFIADYSYKMGAADWIDIANGTRCTHVTLLYCIPLASSARHIIWKVMICRTL